jgi:hypothetical protein
MQREVAHAIEEQRGRIPLPVRASPVSSVGLEKDGVCVCRLHFRSTNTPAPFTPLLRTELR